MASTCGPAKAAVSPKAPTVHCKTAQPQAAGAAAAGGLIAAVWPQHKHMLAPLLQRSGAPCLLSRGRLSPALDKRASEHHTPVNGVMRQYIGLIHETHTNAILHEPPAAWCHPSLTHPPEPFGCGHPVCFYVFRFPHAALQVAFSSASPPLFSGTQPPGQLAKMQMLRKSAQLSGGVSRVSAPA